MLRLSGEGWSRAMAAGTVATFGRDARAADLVVADDRRLHRQCGRIIVGADGWELQNIGRWLTLRIVNLDRFGLDTLRPGQSIRVPWSRVSILIYAGSARFQFSATFESPLPNEELERGTPEAGRLMATDDADDVTALTARPVRIDRTTGYFRALVALCEPQLVDPTSSEVATDLQIALRLNRSALETNRLSGKTVERRLDNCRERFGLKDADERGQSAGLERRDARRRLVELALLSGVVTTDDLSQLDAPGE